MDVFHAPKPFTAGPPDRPRGTRRPAREYRRRPSSSGADGDPVIGARPRSDAEAVAARAARDAQVLRHAPAGVTADLRSPAQVRSLLARIGVDVPDTRAWRLRDLGDTHPLIAALLDWRKAERIATTYGYAWLDENLGPDGRLRGGGRPAAW